MNHLPPVLMVLALLAASPGWAEDTPKGDELAARAAAVLQRNCLLCHNGPGSVSKADFDVRSVETLKENDVVRPGKPEESLIWTLAHRGTMPPRSQPQLARLIGEDSQILSEWIKAGAPEFPTAKSREQVTLEATLKAIATDLRKLPDTRTRSRQRYFSLAEAHNNPSISEDSLLLSRAALSKALNSLSWEPEIVLPREIAGTQQTLFAIDIEKLGWTRDHWRAVRGRYPYSIGFANLKDRTLGDLETEIQQLTERNEPLYMVRADWFIATALQPNLYHALLYDLSLPEVNQRLADKSNLANPQHMTATDLEQYLGVDVIADILRGEEHAMRSGFTPSGVSGQNRLLERHKIKKYKGAYWKSYDFKAANRRAILSQFPLGPVFPGNESPQLAFDHDGGEIIFNLPNGLQAYLLVDGKDNRIDAGPIEVVSDALKTSGSPAIVNGLSCMSCHKAGMIDPPADEIREFSRVFGKQREHVERLYPKKDQFDEKVDSDGELFLRTLEEAIGKIMKSGPHKERELKDMPEPVSEVARNYLLEELDLPAVAAELHEPNTDRLKSLIEHDDLLQNLGLGVLLRQDGKIKRAFWESTQSGTSIMQLTAYTLDYTTPQFKE